MTATAAVDISPTVNSVTKAQNLRVRFFVSSVPGATGFTTSHDLAHVDFG